VGFATNPGGTVTACTFTANNTNTVRNTSFQAPISLLGIWRNGATKGILRMTSPKLVPVTNGIDYNGPAGCTGVIMNGPPYQQLIPQDILTVSVSGGAAESEQAAFHSYYQDLPGVSMTLKSPGDIMGSVAFVFGWRVAGAASGTIGTAGNVAITVTEDSSTANTWYAVLGYTTDALVTAIGITGVDTSQTFIGGPGLLDVFKTQRYFVDQSTRSGLPCIPLFNAANKTNTNVTVYDVAASTAPLVTLIVAEMVQGYTP
jgi:hypothetical protein